MGTYGIVLIDLLAKLFYLPTCGCSGFNTHIAENINANTIITTYDINKLRYQMIDWSPCKPPYVSIYWHELS